MITHIKANLLTYPLNALLHQSNCHCTMSSGIAKSVKETYPEMYEADCKTIKGDPSKLGTFSFAKTNDGKVGYNLYSQFNFGYDGKVYTNYEAMRAGLIKIRDHIKETLGTKVKVGLPARMGCARGGGAWDVVLSIITEVFTDEDMQIFICEFGEYSTEADKTLKSLREIYKKSELLGETE